MIVDITNQTSQHVGLTSDVLSMLGQKAIDIALPNLDKSKNTISLAFVNDETIQRYNRQYRKKDAPTDVLSFSYIADKGDNAIGELIISLDTAKRQAKEHSHDLDKEIEVLFVHGVLHILGYDHEVDSDKVEMLKYEQELLGDKAGLISRVNTV